MTSVAYIALGGNVGDVLQSFRFACSRISELGRVVRRSRVYETPPWGKADQDPFLNATIELHTSLLPEQLLNHLLDIENACGRTRTERWGPRTLDLDLLSFDQIRHETPKLTLPHPCCFDRAFVLLPWAEIAPDWRFLDGPTLMERLRELDLTGIRKIEDPW